MNPRAIAARIIARVIVDKHSLTQAFTEIRKDQRELSLIKMLCFGVLRWYLRLDRISNQLLSKPLKAKDIDIKLLLLIGLFQILYLDTPHHIAVSQTVEATRSLSKPWATDLINAVLRNFIRQSVVIQQKTDQIPSAHYSHPDWLIAKIQRAWPEQWESILTANNQHPPLHLRVNQLKSTRINYLKLLDQQKLAAEALPCCDSAILLNTPQDVYSLPGFSEGLVSVQDCAAQLAAGLLDLQPRQRILDACAAPGGKTTHMAEMRADVAEIVAIDSEARRLERAKDNWQRLALTTPITWITEDVEKTNRWWDGQLFDRVLLDAPCSATGVIRRHPDIKWLRKEQDIGVLSQQQLRLLNTVWPLLKPNGLLVYATCSILPEENNQVIAQFLETHPDVKEKVISSGCWGKSCQYGRQILPGTEGLDGFYYVCLEKM
jgi:16S rRNA (cytosine967-C5)-methyltransferase